MVLWKGVVCVSCGSGLACGMGGADLCRVGGGVWARNSGDHRIGRYWTRGNYGNMGQTGWMSDLRSSKMARDDQIGPEYAVTYGSNRHRIGRRCDGLRSASCSRYSDVFFTLT